MTDIDSDANKGRVILTYGRSLMALSAAQTLNDRGIEIIGCDSLDMTVLQCSRYCSGYFMHRDVEDDPDGFIEDLVEAVKISAPEDDRPYVLMPMFTEAALIAEHAGRFDGLITLALPGKASIDMVEPKSCLVGTAEAARVRAPETWHPSSFDEVEALSDDLPYPVLTKPIIGVGGRGISKHDSADELLEHYRELGDRPDEWPLIQQAVGGEDFCFCVLCKNGEIVAHMAYRNLQSYPRDTGAGVLRETVDDAAFVEQARGLLRHLKWDGVCEIDYRWTGEAADTPYLIEVNARYWAGLFHSIASGIEFPWLQYQLATTGEAESPRDANIGQKTKIPLVWWLAVMQDVAADDDYAQRLSAALQGKDEDDGPLSRLMMVAKSALDIPGLVSYVKQVMDASQDADGSADDFILPEDPNAALGVMFIASSLIRTGKLPPELKQS